MVRRNRVVRVCYFNTWANGLEEAAGYLHRLSSMDLGSRVADPRDSELLKKARLDCDWYGENVRCFAALTHAELHFLPAWVTGSAGLLDLALRPSEPAEERWLIMSGHQPESLKGIAARVLELLHRAGVRILFYAFDEASRCMTCFRAIAPYLDVLIYDEDPLDPVAATALRPDCLQICHSWVANFVPFSVPFNEAPERKILFLGSQLGLTDHRKRQIAFLQQRFKDRFVASHDHSIGIADRHTLNRFKVSVCPEGRKFSTPAMSRSHTDRPFWSGCLGMVPVSENSVTGDRLNDLAENGLVLRYANGDLDDLLRCCEQALEATNEHRRRIYDFFNSRETVGSIVAAPIAAVTFPCP